MTATFGEAYIVFAMVLLLICVGIGIGLAWAGSRRTPAGKILEELEAYVRERRQVIEPVYRNAGRRDELALLEERFLR